MGLSRRAFLITSMGAVARLATGQQRQPNIVLINADDLGYGDLGCYGSSLETPNIDQMAAEGIRLRHFYAASAVCSPSRAALMTGRYPTRVNIPLVLGPTDDGGIPDSEMTMPQVLKSAGYATAIIGKWHLGSQPKYLPTNRGFDEFYGLPYSADMWPRPLMRNNDVVEQPANIDMLTKRFTDQAVQYIARMKDTPFFLYLAHTAPHLPLGASPKFKGTSGAGLYGDAVKELDWSVGQVLDALKSNGLDNNTLVIFTSDNGPWWQGSPGRLRGRKGETYEGGMREPMIARYPGLIPAGVVSNALTNMMDLLPTFARLAGASLPANQLDGIDIWPILNGQQEELDREIFLYFDAVYLQAARMGQWKMHISRYNTRAWSPLPPEGKRNFPLPGPELYDIINDPTESYDCSSSHPDIVADLMARVKRAIQTFPPGIIDAWNMTMNTKVSPDTPDDGLPQAAALDQ